MADKLNELEQLARGVMVFAENETWRVYTGGRLFRRLRGKASAGDSYFPEDWIASVTPAYNPPRDGQYALEGLSVIRGTNVPFVLLIELFPELALGSPHLQAFGPTTRVLAKFLDSNVRLPIQAHPDDALARKFWNEPNGKAEAWIIVGTRVIDGVQPYILLGFKRGVDAATFRKLVLSKDVEGQVEVLHRIPVSAGDVYMVPGRTAHAIGCGVFMIEVQQPSDLLILTEPKCVDVEISDEMCHMGIGWDKALEVFEYGGETIEALRARTKLEPRPLSQTSGGEVSQLISYDATPHFASRSISVTGSLSLDNPRFYAGAVIRGGGRVTWEGGEVELKSGDAFFVPNAVQKHEYEAGADGLQILTSEPPKLP
jgi:mannose-6-phosphate isomerase